MSKPKRPMINTRDPLIDEVLAWEEEFTEDFLRPTDRAVAKADDMLGQVRMAAGEEFESLKPSVSTMGDGGLRLNFFCPGGSLRIAIAPEDNENDCVHIKRTLDNLNATEMACAVIEMIE